MNMNLARNTCMQEKEVPIQVSTSLGLSQKIRIHKIEFQIVDTCQGYSGDTVAATVTLGVS
jgi:hypothetical protein